MKFLLLAFCLGLALAAPQYDDNNLSLPHIQESSFRAGKEYLYQYDTQVMTGLPQTSQIHAGFRIKCHARVQFNTFSKIRVVLDKIVLYRVNEPIVQWKASERLMRSEFRKELVGDETATMEYFLQIPFGFEYDNGQVLRIHLDDKETTWSANIKRGFVSLFEMNLEKRFLLDKSFPAIQSPVPPHVNTYTVFERSTTGDCATLYTVSPNEENDHKYVTKVRDFQQCLDMPIYRNTMWDGFMAEDAEKDNPMVNGATIKYTLRGNDKQFLILSAVGEGRIVFTPAKRTDEVMTTINQTLHLKDSRFVGHEVSEIPEIHHGEHKRDTVKMTLPSRPVDCQDPFMSCTEEPKQVSESADVYSVEKLNLHLQMAARNTEQITSEGSLEHLRIFKTMLKSSPESILKNLWEKLNKAKINPQADIDRLSGKIYWNALADVGTEASANVILDICATQFLLTDNCTYALNRIALKVTPTTQVIQKLITLSNLNRLTSEVKQTAFLALGSFGYKLTREMTKQMAHCQKSKTILSTLLKDNSNDRNNFIQTAKNTIENNCNSIVSKYGQSEEQILKTLSQLLRSPKQDDKILALKAIGNSGLPNSLEILRSFLENPAQPKILRIMAITAHRRITHTEQHRQMAIKSLLKVYLTTTETNEIRTMAFLIMTGLRPELSIYETIAMSLHQEKNSQVSSLVHSFFSSFSNSTYHPDWPLRTNCTSALKFAPEVSSGWEHSFMKRIGQYSDLYRKGHALTFAKVGDISRYFGAALNYETYQYGLISQFVEVGFNTEGLNPFLNKLFGPRGLLTNNKSLFDLLKRGPRDISPQQMIQQIFKELNIKTRSMPNPYGHIYFKVMGHEMRYFDFTNLLRTITTTGTYAIKADREGQLSMGIPVELNTMYDIFDDMLTLPTEAGLPVSLTYQLMSSVNIAGSVSLKVSPNMMETDRQGRPPVAIQSSIDIKPKIVTELQFSMGLDMFYVKPKVGYRGLVKYNAPIQTDVSLDLAYRRMNLKWHTPVMEKPVIEMMLEPYSEFMLFTKKDESPVFMSNRRNIYTPLGTRVMPISLNYKLNSIGHQVALTGQLPHCLSKTDPIRPFHGRTLLNIFFKPMENAPSTIKLFVQDVFPTNDEVSNSVAQTYQEMLTDRPEQYGRDFSRMQDSVRKFDKYGRPLPQSPEEILPYSDPVDINKETPVKMQQMCNKFQRAFGKPMPFDNRANTRGLIALLDASSNNAMRYVQFETLFGNFKNGHIGHMYSRFWRSALPQYDNQDWQLLSEFGVTYPFEVKEPKDIFDPIWQRQLMKDLEHLISLESHKIVNQRMNMTILSSLEQFNYPAMIRAPTYRVLDTLVPEQLYRLMNISGSTIYNRRWDNYWRTLGPVYRQVQEEVRVNVDPSFVKRDLPLNDYLTKVLKVQNSFLRDLRDIISKTIVAHAELPIIQWIDYTQSRTVYMIKEIFQKAMVKDLIHEPDQIRTLLTTAETNLVSIVSLMNQLMDKVTAVSQQLDTEGKPMVVFKPEVLRKVLKPRNTMYAYDHQNYNQYESSSYYTPENVERTTQDLPEDMNTLRISLYKLSLTQVQIIEKIQLAISNKRPIDFNLLTQLIGEVRSNLNMFDNVLKRRPIVDPVTKQSLLLVTVQNEYCIQLLEQWKKCNVEIVQMTKENWQVLSSKMLKMKEQGIYLGERVSMVYHQDLMRWAVVPNLNLYEFPIYQQIAQIKRTLIPELREFETQLAYNFTNMRNSEVFVATCDRFCDRLTSHATTITEIEKSLINLSRIPKVYLVSELMDALNYLKYTTEFGSRTLYSVNNQRRFVYLEKLSSMATKVQTLVSGLSPIFNKYVQRNEPEFHDRVPILNTMPIDTRVLDVQDVIVQQEMLEEQMRRFVQNPDVSIDVLAKVLNVAVDRCEMLQETLKQNQVQVESALNQQKLFEKQAISVFWTKALNQQRSIYESLLRIYNNKRDQLSDVARMTEKIKDLQMEIAQLEGSHEEIISNIRDNHVRMMSENESYESTYMNQQWKDQPRWESQKKLQPLTPFEYLPTGVTALLNFTWGSGGTINKNAKVQFMASRSVEQIMYLFKQMSAVVRSEDFVYSINRRLSEEPWLADNVMQTLNTFNHWHFIAEAEKEELSQWLLDQLQYAQDLFKSTYWNEFDRQPGVEFISDNQVHAMIDISDRNREWDFYLLKNSESNVYQGIDMFHWLQNFPMIQTYRPMEDKVMSYLTNNNKPTQCMVNKDKVYTFDKVNYQLPTIMGKKEALLAADCSDDKAFAITMVKSNTTFDGHIVKIISEDKVIEIIPGYLNVEVRVNGKIIVLDEHKPVILSKKLHYDLYEPHLKIVRKGYNLEVTFPLTGLTFMMEGTFIQIEVSELYKRRLCGMCSNFDTQMSWEYEGPTQEVYNSPRIFAQSYILRKEDRPVFRPNKQEFTVQHDRYYDIVSQYRPKGNAGQYDDDDVPLTADDSSEEWETEYLNKCKPVGLTLMKRRMVRGHMCFSKEEVSKCPTDCPITVQKKRQRIPFVCLRYNNPQVNHLSRLASFGVVQQVSQVKGKDVSKKVKFAIRCERESIVN